jgi:hypothetical protein
MAEHVHEPQVAISEARRIGGINLLAAHGVIKIPAVSRTNWIRSFVGKITAPNPVQQPNDVPRRCQFARGIRASGASTEARFRSVM